MSTNGEDIGESESTVDVLADSAVGAGVAAAAAAAGDGVGAGVGAVAVALTIAVGERGRLDTKAEPPDELPRMHPSPSILPAVLLLDMPVELVG